MEVDASRSVCANEFDSTDIEGYEEVTLAPIANDPRWFDLKSETFRLVALAHNARASAISTAPCLAIKPSSISRRRRSVSTSGGAELAYFAA